MTDDTRQSRGREASGRTGAARGGRVSAEQPSPDRDDLTHLYDDPDDPSEVTIVPAGSPPERYLTEWVTTDAATAVSLAEMR